MMKMLKKSKGYGAFEYTIIIALVIVVALVILNLVKGKATSGAIDTATNKANDVVTDWTATI